MKKSEGKSTVLVKVATFTGLVVFGLVLGLTLFGDNIRKLFGSSTAALAGQDTPYAYAQESHRKAMRNFGMNNYDGAPPPSYAAAPSPAPQAARALAAEPVTTGNTHTGYRPNPFTLTSEDTLSTFAVDVDTASYALFRRTVNGGALPPRDSVRVEEWVNYFKYRLPTPTQGDFHVDLEGAPSPFTPGRHLLKVGLQGRKIGKSQRKPTHLVFLADTSGSMGQADRLPMAQRAMKLMVDGLNEEDTVALVTYAGSVRDVLPPTPASERQKLFEAIDSLSSGGGTAMGDGLQIAYQHAVKKAGPDTVARVIVLTDGDTNLGQNLTADQMLESVRGYVQEGVTLSTIGFGMGNYRDDLMERLANKGNGNCFYIDSDKEARRVFQEQLAGTLEVIAKDVKVQVEFDKAAVRGYRLVGYENRDIADKDFRNDKVDAGEIGAGHTVTALYEVELTGEGTKVATVRVRAKTPAGSEAAEQSFTFPREPLHARLADASSDLRFATAVAGTADIVRGAPQASDWSLAVAEELAVGAAEGMEDREEFVSLLRRVREAKLLNVSQGRTTHNNTY